DLFSLGSVLYALCAGHAPFRAGTSMAVLKRVCLDTPRPLRQVNPDVPDWLEAVIARLHAKRPAGRFPSAAEGAELLGKYLAHLQQPGAVPAPVGHGGGVPGPRAGRRLRAALLVLLGAALLAGGAAVYWVFWRPGQALAPGGADGAGEATQ